MSCPVSTGLCLVIAGWCWDDHWCHRWPMGWFIFRNARGSHPPALARQYIGEQMEAVTAHVCNVEGHTVAGLHGLVGHCCIAGGANVAELAASRCSRRPKLSLSAFRNAG